MTSLTEKRYNDIVVKRIPGENEELVEDLRRAYREAVNNKGYEGFSASFDREFDPHSTYIGVYKNGKEITGTARIIEKNQDNEIPLEKSSSVSNGSHIILPEDKSIVELTTFSFDSKQSLRALVSELAEFGLPRYDCAYATYDPELGLQRLYRRLNFKEPHPGLRISYDGYTRNSEPVEWGILKIDKEGIKELTERNWFLPEPEIVDG